MATNTSPTPTINSILAKPVVKKRFGEILGKRSSAFISSIISAVKANYKLTQCTPDSIISSAVVCATLDLWVTPGLGHAFIIPYRTRGGMIAQFQMGYKGFVQLALRTNQYKTINAVTVYEGQLTEYDMLSGDVRLDAKKKTSNTIIGYVAYFKLLNGFEKSLYWTKEEAEEHGREYSRSYADADSRWQLDFDAMALKSVLKMLLNKWGILSIEMQKAIKYDQALIKNLESMEATYVDSADNKDMSGALQDVEQPQIQVEIKE